MLRFFVTVCDNHHFTIRGKVEMVVIEFETKIGTHCTGKVVEPKVNSLDVFV
ncbi:hypothetical protein [Halodesulfovibrio marinisediminis]|uniref:Uncharacterized protein n=1 Tax=Halodesulfovibrio marinisediminis DSM 17456 TaxID=1121457 RepID=A0A1N6GYT4_9BACT|nr:hypothetical protein [Halodesulfovibrio marinisediminis]SIO12704.1 hypothetical protein SAMN02745161_1899 [Halodesulfovibrio marinisediminis DSM 17456]